MTDKDVTADNNNLALQEEYLKNFEDIEEGGLIEGTVIEITPDQVFIDVGYKSEGKISLEEFSEPPKIGDKVSVILKKKEGRGGQVVVSKKEADSRVFWKNLEEASEKKTPIDGKVCKVIKGGFEVDLGFDVKAFNPISKIDVIRVETPEEYMNLKSKFIIDKFSRSAKARIVVSRRQYLESAAEEAKKKFFESTTIGDDIEGTVKSFTSFGAFIDLGGFDGLLHINDMSWGHVTKPKDYVKKGQVIKLKVIKIDADDKKINLSLKHFSNNPWNTFEHRYHIDDVVKGKVTKLTDFGAFIEIEEGIEGLAHISELSWTKRVNHPKEILSIGDECEAKILAFNLDEGRISLGLKQVLENPWDSLGDKYPVGMTLKKVIKKVTNSGAFVELEEGIDAFLHIDDYSWTRKIKNASSVLKEGEEIEAVVISIEPDTKRVRLGVKQLSDDPWDALKKSYPRGSVIEGEVTNVTDFGIFVRVPGGIEGLINKFNLAEPGADRPDEDELLKKFTVGDKVKALVTEIKSDTQRLSMSIREYQKSLQRAELSKYIHDSEEERNFTLGDMLKDKRNQDE
ncbi:MAG: 30S ribosomal protein S1 [Spirochaetales bacterium]|nr:30S ribosomal protein S1 [Spirochaetales bacterium]